MPKTVVKGSVSSRPVRATVRSCPLITTPPQEKERKERGKELEKNVYNSQPLIAESILFFISVVLGIELRAVATHDQRSSM